ncbi:hypothetical protein NDN08_007100 [Rhodosorus marinus]|uniref:ASPIC/UnbV domain-containing protein n=1 Tax=Rhodosorus marinus TaxID=101924 RepID=A0AAV8UFK7_9RHOD|nr:hypothetical protein NDN08_007100 [Rhodosorus marinus]
MSKYYGATIADIDCDGRYDLFLSNHGNNVEWYYSEGHNMFKSKDPRLYLHDVHGTAAADMDNDGMMDVVVAIGGSGGRKPGLPIYFKVNEDKTFRKDAGTSFGFGKETMRGRCPTFLDIDHDGDLDLVFLNQDKLDDPRGNYVYENMGRGKFRLRENTGLEFIGGWTHTLIDYNNDGNLDFLVFHLRTLEVYAGTGSFKFVRQENVFPANRVWRTTSVAEIDYDNDGDFDLFLARGFPGRYNIPNTLLENRGGKYVDVTSKTNLGLLGHNGHVTYGDFNNDGYIDLYLTVNTDYNTRRQNDIMLLSRKGMDFVQVKNTGTESQNQYEDGNNSIAFDFDLDGKVDILSGMRNSTWNLYRNQTPPGNRHYVIVRVGRPTAINLNPKLKRSPMGAVVTVVTKNKKFMRRVTTPGRSHSQAFMDTLHFGLGQEKQIKSIIVDYMGGVRLVREIGLSVDKIITIGKVCKCPKGTNGPKCKLTHPKCSLKRCGGQRCERMFFKNNKNTIYYCIVGR